MQPLFVDDVLRCDVIMILSVTMWKWFILFLLLNDAHLQPISWWEWVRKCLISDAFTRQRVNEFGFCPFFSHSEHQIWTAVDSSSTPSRRATVWFSLPMMKPSRISGWWPSTGPLDSRTSLRRLWHRPARVPPSLKSKEVLFYYFLFQPERTNNKKNKEKKNLTPNFEFHIPDTDRARKHGMEEYISADPVKFDHSLLFKLVQTLTLDFRLNDPFASLVFFFGHAPIFDASYFISSSSFYYFFFSNTSLFPLSLNWLNRDGSPPGRSSFSTSTAPGTVSADATATCTTWPICSTGLNVAWWSTPRWFIILSPSAPHTFTEIGMNSPSIYQCN